MLMNTRRFRRKIPDGRPEGEVYIDGERARVSFAYSPERVAAIKRIPGARFHKEDKGWSIPLAQLELLERTPLFAKERINYIADALRSNSSEEGKNAREAALARVKENPFSVPEEIIKLLPLDAVVRLHARGDSLRVATRFRSRAEEVLKKIHGVHVIKGEQSYLLPAAELTNFIKQLRDARLSFGVEETAGRRLSETAALRQQILNGEYPASAEELLTCVLTPIVDQVEGEADEIFAAVRFSLYGASSVQLKEFFPDAKSFSERQKISRVLTEQALLRLVQRANRFRIPLYLTKRVTRHLEKIEARLSAELATNTHFDEAYLSLISLPQCWVGEESGLAGLVLDRSSAIQIDQSADHPLKAHPRELHPIFPGKLFYQLSESILLERYEALCAFQKTAAGTIPESSGFIRLKRELLARRKLLQRREHFQKARDLPLPKELLSNAAAADKLFPHQRVAVQWLIETERAFLGDDMGLGKTLSVLTAFDALKNRGNADFLLIACPNSLTRNWVRECGQWYPNRKLMLLPNEKAEKLKLLRILCRGDISVDGLVVNYETLRLEYIFPQIKELIQTKRTLLCLDESQRVKNASSKTFEALREVARVAPRRVLLSGTPTPKDISDIWAQMHLLDDGARFGDNFYDWLKSIAELGNKYSEFAVKKLKPGAVTETIARVHEILLRRKKEDVVDLPEKTFSVRDIELSGDQLARYEEICDGLLLRVTSLSGHTFVREIDSVLEEYLRAVQVASNPRLIDEKWGGEPAKFKELDQIVQEVVAERNEKVVIWTNYLKNIAELVARYAAFGAAPFSGNVTPAVREETIYEFQKGKECRVLVAIPAAGGVGITLTAAQTAIYIDKTWNAEHWLQSIDRIHRIGQRGTVNVISLSACKIDEVIARNLARKERLMARLLGDRLAGGNAALAYGEEAAQELPSREELLEALGK